MIKISVIFTLIVYAERRVISHVTEMTERIAVQIKVTKTANGKSEVTVCGN